jgi:hypothetical protein
MSVFSAGSALEPHVQFETGFNPQDREGRYKAPASGTWNDGVLVKVNADGIHLELCGANDADFITEQPVNAAGAIGTAAARELYLQGVPQNAVQNDAEITVYSIGGGKIINTDNTATGSDTGAITTSTAVNTEVEAYNGVWRELQAGNTAVGKLVSIMDSRGFVRIQMY